MPPCHHATPVLRFTGADFATGYSMGILDLAGDFPGSSLGRCLSWLFMTSISDLYSYTMLYGYGSIPIDTFLVEWTSIYQLFWCSPGVQGFDPSHILVQDHPNLPRLWVDSLWDEFLCERKREVRLWLRQVATALSGWPLFGLLAQVSLRKVRPGVLVGWCVASNQIHEVYQSSIDHPKKI